jgi:CPA2 family monovalent cation:H+ antiporter-2
LDSIGLGHLQDVLVLLVAAIAAVWLFQRLRISPVLGYLAAGLAVGPHGLGFIQEADAASSIAEFGVIFLLFTIGLDLPLQRLRAIWRYVFGLGLAQVALTSLVLGGVARGLGAAPDAALVIGGALAFSSTATVLQLLAERGELASRHGRMSLAVLLFQDLAVVPLLALLPVLNERGTALIVALAAALLKAAVTLGAIVLLGRWVLRPIYRGIAATRNADIFAATSLLLVLGMGWATAQAGMSMALGAFLAGLLLAGTEFRHQVEADIRPFRGLFLGLFFVTVGMTVDLPLVARHAAAVLAITAGLLAAKSAILAGLGLAAGLGAAFAARLGLTLAQGGEFAFVVLSLAATLRLLPREAGQVLTAAIGITMALTPLLALAGRRAFERLQTPPRPDTERLAAEAGDLANHVIVAGYGRIGAIVGDLLATKTIPFVAIDSDARCVADGRRRGAPIYFGDASRVDVLRAAGVDRAAGAVITLDEPEEAERIVAQLRGAHPDLPIVARSRDAAHGRRLARAGANSVVLEALEPGLQIAAAALRLAGTAATEIGSALDAARRTGLAARPSQEDSR